MPPSIITEKTNPSPPNYPKPSDRSYPRHGRIITYKNTNNSPIQPNSSPMETKRNRSQSKIHLREVKNQEREEFVKVKNMVNIENKIKN